MCVCVCSCSGLFLCTHVLLSHLLRWTGLVLPSRVCGHGDWGIDQYADMQDSKRDKTQGRAFEVVGGCGWHTEGKKVKRRGRTGGEVRMWSEKGRERRSPGNQKLNLKGRHLIEFIPWACVYLCKQYECVCAYFKCAQADGAPPELSW